MKYFGRGPKGEDPQYIGEVAEKYVRKFARRSEADTTYASYDKDGKFYIAIILGNDIVVGKDEYKGTPGLWELIVSKNPDAIIYTYDDYKNYAKLM